MFLPTDEPGRAKRQIPCIQLPLHEGKQLTLTGIAQNRHRFVVVEDPAVGVNAAIAGVLDSLVPVDRRPQAQPGLSSCVRSGNAGVLQPEVLCAPCSAVLLGIDASVDKPLAATGGMDADFAGGKADFAKAFERF
ncbi:hypothetical protein BHD05_05285 [Marisediminicola antarctica]|uniref:Uncharacterized protein n=1 Tax=Marisediminicola antarctica TaxID=674079 RepID=A0A7L5AGN7_9MICO|nr:hypothetical protein BHD05_05285 [Marisediminicola antarctica]